MNLEWTAQLCLCFSFPDTSKMSFKDLSFKNPKLAIEKMSEDYKIYCERVPPTGKYLRLEVKQVCFLNLRIPRLQRPKSKGKSYLVCKEIILMQTKGKFKSLKMTTIKIIHFFFII